MKKGIFILMGLGSIGYAGQPVWTFTPLTATSISVPANGTGNVQYTVTNQSRKTHTLVMNAIQGITQDTSGSYCKNPFTLGYQQSCTLKLNITGSQLTGNVNGGPVVCDQGSQGLQCYQPSTSNALSITIGSSEYSVGGNISGLTGTVYLENNSSNQQNFNSNGPFTFTNKLTSGQTYYVTVAAQPNNQTCSVANASGVIASSNITNVLVTCSTNAYTVGGTVSGLTGTVVLQDNGGDNLTINSNGGFAFSTPVANGSPYNVAVMTQPAGQTCTVSNGSGTISGGNVTNVGVSCSTNATTLTTSVSQLALSVTGLTEYGVTGTPFSGVARQITITNTGSIPAVNLTVTPPTWPAGTNITSDNCNGSTLAAGATCTITITPGSSATSGCDASHTAPTPGVVTVSATNVVTSVTTNVVVLGYSCQYQGGYVYAFNDTTSNTGSVGGKVATTSDQSTGVIWSSNGTSGASANVVYNAIYGISETSTTSSANPSAGQVSGQTACNGRTNGACNTNNIYVYYQNNATNHPINLAYYAAGLCKQTISSYSDWYLPAICEMGYGPGGCGTSGAPTLQNMQKSLIDISGLSVPAGVYWSSTEYSFFPELRAWLESFASGGRSYQSNGNKNFQLGVRCSRAF